jgi:ATP-dependent Lhr-like helicase
LGIKLLDKIIPVIEQSNTTLIFTNTRSQSEIWYQRLLDAEPSLAGRMAIHHGSLNTEVRNWVETMLHAGQLKAVVCTSSLDLGVDFRPVDTVIQIGSPKGVARFAQRAGRSGHRPGVPSNIWFVPTHTLELLEAASLKTAMAHGIMESRIPVIRCFDVLIQYLVTLAVSDGFDDKQTYLEVQQTHAFQSITLEEWKQILSFLQFGGDSLGEYDEYHRVVQTDAGFKVLNRKTAMQHRMSIGTIPHDQSMMIKFTNGQKLGSIEEYFISRLSPGDCFVSH